VNGENVADGVGITPKLAKKLFEFGADAITLGNHTWRRPEVVGWIDTAEHVVRPANFSKHAPGRALTFVPARDGTTVAVINVMGYLFLEVAYNPFEVIDDLVEEARAQTPVVFVDMHGEATSEKVALSRWLDGRVSAVIGTHTHVQTNDARVQAGGTAALTDAGMTGPHDSVIGVTAEQAISRMRTGLPVRFETAQGGVRIEGALVECAPDGRATRCETVRVEVS
jgi:2',3'-cyclic-nucleotide 2'-phosphodiesterase